MKWDLPPVVLGIGGTSRIPYTKTSVLVYGMWILGDSYTKMPVLVYEARSWKGLRRKGYLCRKESSFSRSDRETSMLSSRTSR